MRGKAKILVSFGRGGNLIDGDAGRAMRETEFKRVSWAEGGGVANGMTIRANGQSIAPGKNCFWIKLIQTAAQPIKFRGLLRNMPTRLIVQPEMEVGKAFGRFAKLWSVGAEPLLCVAKT